MRFVVTEWGKEHGVILVNRSLRGIAAISQVWRFHDVEDRSSGLTVSPGPNTSLLLPFGLSENQRELYGYWHVILPGSSRLLTADGQQLGDNSDVRPPREEECWRGGIIGAAGGSHRARGPLREVSLTLDGVFFTDGSFAGPDRVGLFETIVSAAEAYREAGRVAHEAQAAGLDAIRILEAVEQVTGPFSEHPPPPPAPAKATSEEYRQRARRVVGLQIGRSQRHLPADRTVEFILAWNDLTLPDYRKI